MKLHRTMMILIALLGGVAGTGARADEAAVEEMAAYFDFVDYGGGVIFADQIGAGDLEKFLVIDTRDAGQFAQDHLPGAIHIEWRQLLSRRAEIPKDKPVLVYCNTGSLSAQAGFAMRVAGWENVLILQGGLAAWRARHGAAPEDDVPEAADASAPTQPE
ncbi:MAG TPA: rhodanese-like domain-containing protein [Patescibacteria group bacterium]|nr:rhodanese-like domain-containing protein [Patescibacteria group bacterium]